MRIKSTQDSSGTAAGFALSGNAVIGVQVRGSRGALEVVKAVSAPFPETCVEGSMILDRSRVGAAFRTAASDLGVKPHALNLAAPPTVDSMRGVRLPAVPEAERRTLVRGELEQLAALVQGADAFDFLWIPAPADEGRRRADATAYFCTDAVVDGIREAMRQGGFRLEALEPPSLAQMRAVLASLSSPGPVAVLCLSESHSDLCIHDGTTLRHVRRIPAGTKDLSAPATPEPDYTLADLNGADDAGPALDVMASPSRSTQDGTDLRVGSSASFLVSEIQRTLAFFAREHPDSAQPELLSVVGAEGPAHALVALLSTTLPLPVNEEHPMLAAQSTSVGTGTGAHKAYLAAAGVAVANLGSDYGVPRLNIAQQEASVARRRAAPNTLLAGVAAGGVCLVLAVLAMLGLGFLQARAETDIAQVGRQISALQAERAPIIANGEIAVAAQQARQKSQIPAASILGRVAAAAQPGISLTAIRVTPDGHVALEGDAADDQSMQRFAYIAGQGNAIRSPMIDMMHLDPKGSLSFRMVGVAPGGQAPATQSSQFR